ncbi:NAD(P)-dependent alcohol dehydrogenase [Kineococcus rubinsiae]|uniref:NAD(P)-dependent alcohol dehydrogenase n=1 Tax=Kineococcus rubinsiae TaxID=2609562 RepID=UPI001430604A|nr:NAD(P)-dependent alcohol dehydrogenase [Kineococcus rubinsiae]NIZ93404.1 NAD(P)-dependent alcohol dehydrogenase [Kineococcus rubinsiae]
MNLSAVLHAPRDLRVEERPRPVPGPHEVLVRPGAVGICGSDVHYYEHGRIGSFVLDAPMVVGHEAAGTVVEVGPAVDPARVGELVALEPGVPDRTCEQCLAGRYNLCPQVRFFATPPVDGALAHLVAIDASFAHPVPAGLDVEQAAMAEPVSVGVWACRRAGVGPGDRVLVTGAGPVGLFAAQVARATGASAVTVTDVSPFRLEVARELGFGALDAREPLAEAFDVLLECSGAAAAFTTGCRALAPAGRAVLVGMGADTVSLDVPLLQGREITVTGTFRYAGTYPAALSLLASGRVRTDVVVTHRFPLAGTDDALTLARRDPRSLKALVLPQE